MHYRAYGLFILLYSITCYGAHTTHNIEQKNVVHKEEFPSSTIVSREEEFNYALEQALHNQTSNLYTIFDSDLEYSMERIVQCLNSENKRSSIKFSKKNVCVIVNRYILKHLDQIEQPLRLVCYNYTPLAHVLINIILEYKGKSIYQLPSLLMHYLGTQIFHKISIEEKKIISALPYCVDEKGDNLFYYPFPNLDSVIAYKVDLFSTKVGWGVFNSYINTPSIRTALKHHILNIKTDPELFISSREGEIFSYVLREAADNLPHFIPIGAPLVCDTQENLQAEDFEKNSEYKFAQNYIAAVPRAIINTHNAYGQCIFDYIDAGCDSKIIKAKKITSLLKLLLEHKADPNIRNKDGNTFLHRIVLNENYFINSMDLEHSPFIQLCKHQLNLTLRNENKETVFDILRTQIEECTKKQDFNTHASYQQCAQVLQKLASKNILIS